MNLGPSEVSTQEVESALDRVRFTVLQRPWTPSWSGVAGIALVATGAALVAQRPWVALVVALMLLLPANLWTTRIALELGLGGLSLRGWEHAGLPRPVRLEAALEKLDVHWTPTRAPVWFGQRTWRVEVRHRDGVVVLPHVVCTWDELNRLRTALRRGQSLGIRRGGTGSADEVPEALTELR